MDLASESQQNLPQTGDENRKTEVSPTEPTPATDRGFPQHNTKDPEWEAKKAKYKESIESAFDALVPGMQISVNRTRPGWASGWLDTIPVEFDENDRPQIDLQTIKDTFGGENLQLKFLDQNGQFLYAKTVHFRGIPPKENGIELENPAVRQRRELMELEARNKQQEDGKATERLFMKMLERQDTSHKDMLTLLTQTNKANNDPFSGMNNMFRMMEQFDRFRNGNNNPFGGDNDNGLGDMIGGLMQMFSNFKQQQPAQPQYRLNPAPPPQRPPMPRQHYQQPSPPPPAPVPVPAAAAAAAAPPQPVVRPVAVPEDAQDEFEDVDLVDEICGMDDQDIADTVADLMDRLGEERGQRVLQIYLSGNTNSGNLDDDDDEPDGEGTQQ